MKPPLNLHMVGVKFAYTPPSSDPTCGPKPLPGAQGRGKVCIHTILTRPHLWSQTSLPTLAIFVVVGLLQRFHV